MSRFQHPTQFFLVFLVAILVLLSCRQKGDKPHAAPPPQQQSTSTEVAGYLVEELSAIGSYLPVLDDGRLQVAPPIDWHLAPRSKGYVARFIFARNRRLALPRITVAVQEAAAKDPRNLNQKNLVSYIELMVGRMDEKMLQVIDGEVEPLLLGDAPCARYVVNKKFRQGERVIRTECEVLRTIRAGRVYTVSLDVVAGTLVRYRADAYAVMATMQFPLAKDPDGAESEDEPERTEEQPQEST